MEFLEKDLEQIIWESDNEILQDRGLEIRGKKIRQLRIGKYGVADLVSFERVRDKQNYLLITVYELKKDKAGISAFLQAIRYCKGIKNYILKRKGFKINFKFNIVICGKTIDTQSDYIFIADLFESDQFYTVNNIYNYSYKFKIDGLYFKEEKNYSLTDEGF